MKILHVITSLRTGGAERLVADVLPRLRDRGHRVALLLFDGTRTPLRETLEQQGIEIHALGEGAFQMRNPFHLFRLRAYLKRERFDVVHAHNTACQLLTALAAGGMRSDVPALVTTEHNTFNRRRNWRWFLPVDRWMYGRYRRIICVGGQTQRNLAERLGPGIAAERLSVVPNGIPLGRFLEALPDETLRTETEKGRHLAVMVSAFRPQKDQPTLIRAMQLLPDDYRLWLVGDGPLRPACERLARELGVENRVRFLGPRSDIPALLATADVAVLSSHYEGMSLSSLEGMASGRPLVASDVDGLREVVEGAGLLVPHEAPGPLADCIRQLAERPEYASAVGARCRERALEYDIDKVVTASERIYETVVNQK